MYNDANVFHNRPILMKRKSPFTILSFRGYYPGLYHEQCSCNELYLSAYITINYELP